MNKGNYLSTILRSPKTIFTLTDVALLWQEENMDAARVRLNYYVKQGDLYRIRRGIYAKSQEYDKLELATRTFTPSYISFETVLAQEGLIFQFQTPITVASYLTREIYINEQVYIYRKLKDAILMNAIGVKHENNISIAIKERAFLDTIYIRPEFHFDNLRSLHWDTVFSILPLYNNKKLNQRVKKSKKLWS